MLKRVSEIDVQMAERLRTIRGDLGLSQHRIALKLGIAYQSYQKMEYGKVCFRLYHLPMLADALGISIDDLVRGVVTERGHNGRETTRPLGTDPERGQGKP